MQITGVSAYYWHKHPPFYLEEFYNIEGMGAFRTPENMVYSIQYFLCSLKESSTAQQRMLNIGLVGACLSMGTFLVKYGNKIHLAKLHY